MPSHASHITPVAVPQLNPAQPCACAISTAAPLEFADRIAHYAEVRRGVAEASGEVVAAS
jgi:hypothetical protein